MFSDTLSKILVQAERIGSSPPIPARDFVLLLESSAAGNRLSIEEIYELLNGTLSKENWNVALEFVKGYRRPHDKEILLLPPLYFTSICESRCSYCDFSEKGIRLTPEQFMNEFETLMDLNYRSIELVCAQDPELFVHIDGFSLEGQRFNLDPVLGYFESAKKRLIQSGGGMLTSNIPPVDLDSFRRLKGIGLDCYLIWLETFNPSQYSMLHDKKSPKSNQAFRLDSMEMAAKAGVEHLAGAFLKGLYEWRKEELVLYCMDAYLEKTVGHGFSILGSPRLKGKFATSELVNSFAVSDEEYELNVALDRILFNGILWLQTREPFELNRRLINRFGGDVILTLTCSTAPGGYHSTYRTKAQFPVHKQELAASVRELEDKGFNVRFDWNSETLSSFQRRTST
jgi:2-iminoacetate synthase ThiH